MGGLKGVTGAVVGAMLQNVWRMILSKKCRIGRRSVGFGRCVQMGGIDCFCQVLLSPFTDSGTLADRICNIIIT